MAEFIEAPDSIVKMMNKLRSLYHSELIEARIKMLLRMGSWKSKGKDVFAKTYKVNDRDKALHGYDYLIVINEDIWSMLPEDKRMALLDHELCHCLRVDDEYGNATWKLASHDVEEFSSVVRRHGLWQEDLKKFMHSYQQMDLFKLKQAAGER